MVHELHKRGYPKLRICPGMAPSGCAWRCSISHVANILRNAPFSSGRLKTQAVPPSRPDRRPAHPAKPKDEDPERGLTLLGADAVARMAAWAAGAGFRVDEIRHSGKLRAQQTAEIFARHLSNAPIPQAVSGLAPNDDVEPIAQQLAGASRPIMLVGHLPFLESLTSLLVADDADASVASLEAGALLALAKCESGWNAVCLMQPKLLPES